MSQKGYIRVICFIEVLRHLAVWISTGCCCWEKFSEAWKLTMFAVLQENGLFSQRKIHSFLSAHPPSKPNIIYVLKQIYRLYLRLNLAWKEGGLYAKYWKNELCIKRKKKIKCWENSLIVFKTCLFFQPVMYLGIFQAPI